MHCKLMISMSENDELSEFVRPSLSVQSQQQQQEEGEVELLTILHNFYRKKSFQKRQILDFISSSFLATLK